MSNQASTQYICPVHGGRDNYQAQLALFERNLLNKVIVEISPGTFNAFNKLTNNLKKIKRDVNIPKKYFHISKKTFFHEFFDRFRYRVTGHQPSSYSWLESARLLGVCAGSAARKYQLSVFAELYSANWSFQNSNSNTNSINVLFQTHPYIRYLDDLYSQTTRNYPAAIEKYPLVTEAEIGAPEIYRIGLERAAQRADQIICASTFTKKSLVQSGINPNIINVVPYGVDSTVFFPTDESGHSSRDIFKIVFVGQSSERKNLDRLIHAWEILSLPESSLILVGGGISYNKLLMNRCNISSTGRVTNDSLRSILSDADVLILPSIAEGFGLVILQSIGCGTPVIATDHTGLVDILHKYDVGKIIPYHDLCNLEGYIEWAYYNRGQLHKMRKNCIDASLYYSWERFRASIGYIVERL